jgi:phosphatidylethanolamine-binding protein (PEBP) family uncharacterized protein
MEILAMALILTSPAFANNGVIPKQYSCEGTDISPPLQWSGAPQGTKSFALIIDDPDAPDPRAPKMTWVHWVVYNIPADVHGLPEGAAKAAFHRERSRASTIGNGPVTAAPVHRSGGMDTFTSFPRSTRCCRISGTRRKLSFWMR